jgi:hypothetical protein
VAAFNPVHRLAGPFCGVSSAVLPDHSTGGLPELHHAEGDGLAVELCAGITQTLSVPASPDNRRGQSSHRGAG